MLQRSVQKNLARFSDWSKTRVLSGRVGTAGRCFGFYRKSTSWESPDEIDSIRVQGNPAFRQISARIVLALNLLDLWRDGPAVGEVFLGNGRTCCCFVLRKPIRTVFGGMVPEARANRTVKDRFARWLSSQGGVAADVDAQYVAK